MTTMEIGRPHVEFHPSRMPYLATIVSKIQKRDKDAIPGVERFINEIHTQLVDHFTVADHDPDAKFPFSYVSSIDLSSDFNPHRGKKPDKKVIVFHLVGSGGNPSNGIHEAITTLASTVAAARNGKDVAETMIYSLGYPTNPGGEVTQRWNERTSAKQKTFEEHAKTRAALINSILMDEDPERTEVFLKSNSMGTWIANYALALGLIDEKWQSNIQLVLNNPPGYFEDQTQGKTPWKQIKRRARQLQLCLGFKIEEWVQNKRNARHEAKIGQDSPDHAYFKTVSERHHTVFEDTAEQQYLKEVANHHDRSAAIHQPPLIRTRAPIHIYRSIYDLMRIRPTDVWSYARGRTEKTDDKATTTLVPVGHRPKYYSEEILMQMMKVGRSVETPIN